MHRNILYAIIFFIYSASFYNQVKAQASIDKQILEAEKAKLVGGASKIQDKIASGGFIVSLSKSGQAVRFDKFPKVSKLAIR